MQGAGFSKVLLSRGGIAEHSIGNKIMTPYNKNNPSSETGGDFSSISHFRLLSQGNNKFEDETTIPKNEPPLPDIKK